MKTNTTTPVNPGGLRIAGKVRLDAERLPEYLIEKGLLSARDIVDGGLVVQDLSRRNLNFSVKIAEAGGLLVKQVGSGNGTTDFSQLRAEADVLHHLNNEPVFAPMDGLVPHLNYYDEDNGIVVTELVTPGTSLTKYHLNAGDVHFPESAAATVATILAAFHESGAEAARRGVVAHMAGKLPLGVTSFVSPYAGNQAKAKRLFDSAYGESPQIKRIQSLLEDWGAHQQMFHGDIRLDNFLLTAGRGGTGGLNLKLIDWELAGVGDPLWDVACLQADYLRFWALCASNFNPKDADDYVNVAPFEKTAMAGFLATFWRTYAHARGWSDDERRSQERRLRGILPTQILALAWEHVSNMSRDTEVEELPHMFWAMAGLSDLLENDWDAQAPALVGIGGAAHD